MSRRQKLGYYPSQTSIINVTTNEFIRQRRDAGGGRARRIPARVSGFIRDSVTSLPIQDAGVALYQLAGGVETVIDTTRTNVLGMYLFTNVQPGTYLVKSTKQEVVA